MPAAAVPAIIGAVGAIGGGLLSGSKNKGTSGSSNQIQYNSGRSPQAQALEKQMYDYISQGMNKPVPYAQVNPMANQGMNLLSRMFMGQSYTPPQYGMSEPGGGPTGMGMPQQQGFGGGYGLPQSPQRIPSPYRMSPEGPGMPQQGGGMPQQIYQGYQPPRFYGQR